MRIGYACKTIAVANTQTTSCIAAKATEERLVSIITSNLEALENILKYNLSKDIRLFRISSDIIPFGSSPINTLDWVTLFQDKLQIIGTFAIDNGMRLSMHPGQYTVINSPREEVVTRAIEDLCYHCAFLDALGLSSIHKIILHIGGVYGDKEAAIERFCNTYQTLPDNVKQRIVIENDERNYNIAEVYGIGTRMHIPVVFDNLHHAINPPIDSNSEQDWIVKCQSTWQSYDGPQKMHYSQQDIDKRTGAHSKTIDIEVFGQFIKELKNTNIDIMLEVKDKNKSAVKCNNLFVRTPNIRYLEEEWASYKYEVMAQSNVYYLQMKELLKDKDSYPVVAFYQLLKEALLLPATIVNQVNALQHVWGYFKKVATTREKNTFFKYVKELQEGQDKEVVIRLYLQRLAVKYHQTYLLQSYYLYPDN